VKGERGEKERERLREKGIKKVGNFTMKFAKSP